MATHSSVLAWRIPGTGKPGGLLSMGSHRVGHDWSDLAVAAASYPRDFFDFPEVLYHLVSPLDFLRGRMGVLKTEWHGLVRPWSIRPCLTGAVPNKISWQKGYCFLLGHVCPGFPFYFIYFPGGSYNKGDPGSIPGSGRSSGEGNGNPLQFSSLENPMDRGAW